MVTPETKQLRTQAQEMISRRRVLHTFTQNPVTITTPEEQAARDFDLELAHAHMRAMTKEITQIMDRIAEKEVMADITIAAAATL